MLPIVALAVFAIVAVSSSALPVLTINGEYPSPPGAYKNYGTFHFIPSENEILWDDNNELEIREGTNENFIPSLYGKYNIASLKKRIPSIIDENSSFNRRALDKIGGGALIGKRALDSIGGGALIGKRALDRIGGGALIGKRALDSIGGGALIGKRTLDKIGGSALIGRSINDDEVRHPSEKETTKRTYGSLSLGGSYGTAKRGDLSLLRLGSGFGRTSRSNIRLDDFEVLPHRSEHRQLYNYYYLKGRNAPPHILKEPSLMGDDFEIDKYNSGSTRISGENPPLNELPSSDGFNQTD